MSGQLGTRIDMGDWEAIDRTLRGLADQRAKLDAEEAKWLREAERVQIWRQFGCASLLEYMERRLGYGPRAAQERLRVAFALDKLPVLAETLASAELPFTAVRELTRVVTPETEATWIEASQDKNVHEIQAMVSGHKLGDLPTDEPDPLLVDRVLRFDVDQATYARNREAKAALERRHGCRLDDAAFLNALYALALDAQPTASVDEGRAKYQVAITVCERCRKGWQHGDGFAAPLNAAGVERALCDAQHLGSLDGLTPVRARQDVTPSVRRFVMRRDGGKCTVPGCRSTRNLDVHHIIHREHGGSHEPDNLTVLCEAHHTQLHDGLIAITGKAPKISVARRHDPNVTPKRTKLDDVTAIVGARTELVKRGYSKAQAAAAVELARAQTGERASVDLLVTIAIEHAHVGANSPQAETQ
jgi:hypothetical protein